jgi:protein-tyrosine phosphatase
MTADSDSDPAREGPARIDLLRCDDPRDALHRAVAALAGGGLVTLPTDGPPATIALALHEATVRRLLDGMAARDVEGRLTLVLRHREELNDWAGPAPMTRDRLSRRCWPGPVVLSLMCSGADGLLGRLPSTARDGLLGPDGRVWFRCPGHTSVLEVLDLSAGPLVLAGAIEDDRVDLVLERPGLVTRALVPPSVVRCDANGWDLEFEGQVTREEMARRVATTILFVCTGNTCRSPMAQALMRSLLAERLDRAPEDLLGAGFLVLSAGLSPQEGSPASRFAVEVMRERGLCLDDHASAGVDADLIDGADLILAMTPGHLDAMIDAFPHAADRMRLVSDNGQGIIDPYGGALDQYRRTADMLASCIERLVDAILPPGPA